MTDFKGSIVEFAVNGRRSRGYLALPDGVVGPGVIVIQEWWGLVPHIKKVADRFAQAGYAALAPDLYHGEAAKSPDEAGKLMMALDIARAERDLRGAVEELSRRVEGAKIGVVGFCMGGQLALYAASKNPAIGACVDFYGIHPKVEPDLSAIRAPVLGLFAEKDTFVTPKVAQELESELKAAGVTCDFHVYPGVDHAFFNDEREVYDRQAANDAWKRVNGFFSKHLKTA